MALLKDFFYQHDGDAALKGISHKNMLIKQSIIAYMAVNGQCTLAELTKALHISVPTMTKLVGELVGEDIVVDNGKVETAGGRRPNIFGLANTAIYFAGIDIGRDYLCCVLTDLKNNIIVSRTHTPFTLVDDAKCLADICAHINEFLDTCGVERSKILGLGACIAGRVNPQTGHSYMYFTGGEGSLKEAIERATGLGVLIENDTRARCYAEYYSGNTLDEKNVLYLHLGRGVAIGIIADGKLYYGKSGFAGEFGHTPFFNNEIICSCGKKGCLETEVSGIAIENKIVKKISEGVNTILRDKWAAGDSIHIDDIIAAAKNDDNLSIELIEEAGEKIGKSIAFLINIFNPEVVIIGGNMSHAGDYLMLPLKSATNKYSMNLVYKDTSFRLSQMGADAGALGAAMLIRNKVIGL
ncbi:MAG: ROK family transcriptional regulator [Rikenellaceae bacterium]|nr:ROK family transcriptional regulator [Rikenellaceae bacterium]